MGPYKKCLDGSHDQGNGLHGFFFVDGSRYNGINTMGMIGCYLSHAVLWKLHVDTSEHENDLMLIVEDDLKIKDLDSKLLGYRQ